MAVPGQIGSYRVERLLGTGSFATVWLAHDAVLDGHVAIKVLADNWSHDLRVRERFLEEGRLLWKLDDERVLRVHAVGELPDGRPYLVTAWADGGSLRDLLAGGPLAAEAARAVVADLADAVAVLHARSIVHRDLTPGNVLFRTRVGGQRQLLLADLGLAKALAAASGLTARAGTPGYMAPEQDDPLAQVDARADVFALGVLGRELLGDRATPAERAVLDRATALDPSARPADAAAFADAWAGAQRPAAAPAAPAAPGERPPRSRRARAPRRATLSAAAAAVLTGVAVVVVLVVARRDPPATATDRSGRIEVIRPAGWGVDGGGWSGQRAAAGTPAPGLVVAPDPARWTAAEEMPGVFVGVSGSLGTTAAAYVDALAHLGCTAAPARAATLGSHAWTIVRHECGPRRRAVVEAAAPTGDGAEVVYVQLTEWSGSPAADVVLAGVVVR